MAQNASKSHPPARSHASASDAEGRWSGLGEMHASTSSRTLCIGNRGGHWECIMSMNTHAQQHTTQ